MIDTDIPETKFAIHAVRLASRLVKQVQAELVSAALTKDDLSPVTVADFASQALVGYLAKETFPGDPLVAEEDSTALRTASSAQILEQITKIVTQYIPKNLACSTKNICAWIDHGTAEPGVRFWTLDPIDGTKGFLRGDQYAVALALIVDGWVRVGVLGCPNLRDDGQPEISRSGSLYVAVKGEGAWAGSLEEEDMSFVRLRVSDRDDPSHARILRSFVSGHTNVDQIDQFASKLGVAAEPVCMDSQAKYAVLASGMGELYLRLLSPNHPNYREKIWDQAAGSLLVEEAGGQITDLDGKPLNFSAGRTLACNRGVLASNRRLHPAALQALHAIGA